MRPPIEMMVDQACGYNPDADTRPAKPAMPEEAQDFLLAVADAAEDWYIAHRGLEQLSESEKRLADAVRAWLEIGGGKGAA